MAQLNVKFVKNFREIENVCNFAPMKLTKILFVAAAAALTGCAAGNQADNTLVIVHTNDTTATLTR